MLSNRIELIEVVVACGWIGAAAVPINTAAMGPQIGYVLGDCAARLLGDRGRLRRAAGDGRARRRGALGELGRRASPAARLAGETPRRRRPFDARRHRTAAVAAAARRSRARAPDPRPRPVRHLAVLYTSGTTGRPRACSARTRSCTGGACTAPTSSASAPTTSLHDAAALPHQRDQHLRAGVARRLPRRLRAARLGVGVLADDARARGDRRLPARRDGADSARAARVGCRARPRVRIGLGPGVPASAAAAFRERTGVPLLEGYGSTETNFVIASANRSLGARRMGWLGPASPPASSTPTTSSCPRARAGELVLRADEPLAFSSGYFGKPRRRAAWRNGWFHTGDRVVRDADGCFRFVDRLRTRSAAAARTSRRTRSSRCCKGHPAVASVAVYPVRSELAEDEVMAALVARRARALDPAELARFCATRLPYFAIPRFIEIVADLPRTENGKVQKYKLRERGVTRARGTGRRRRAIRPSGRGWRDMAEYWNAELETMPWADVERWQARGATAMLAPLRRRSRL
jgi:crotonobetaine/carnitine-CoA ligase